jgi:hypothetical protein
MQDGCLYRIAGGNELTLEPVIPQARDCLLAHQYPSVLEDIGEISDGREPWRPVRHHFGITSFGINA